MLKQITTVLAVAGSALLGIEQANAQVVTSYYAAPAPVAAAPLYAAPIGGSPIVGSIPVRRGLFGLRTEYVPVFAPGLYPAAVAAPVVAAPLVASPYQAARPIIAPTPYYATPNYAAPYSSAYAPAVPATPYVPNSVYQSGYRGVAPLPYQPYAPAPVQSFYPGAVITFQ